MTGDESRQAERFERLMEVVALAAVGEYEGALAGFEEPTEDQLGMLAAALRVFIGELQQGKAARDEADAALRRAQKELDARLALIEDQRREIRTLSTPVIDLWEGVLVVPLVGALDHMRAREITEKLLQRVVEARARWCLVDLTGVDGVDAATAEHLVRLARAVRLLGARCIITGLSPSAAESFAELGIEAGVLRCLSNLREGLRHCLTAGPGVPAGRGP